MTPDSGAKRIALLDRDGTIIVDKVYLRDPDLIEFAPGAIEGLKLLRDSGFVLLLVTNQSGVARGYFDEACLARIHDRLEAMLARHGIELAKIYYCPHGPNDNCQCRKPATGMVRQAMADFGFCAGHAVVIGDSDADMRLAEASGIRGIRIGSEPGSVRNFRMAAEQALELVSEPQLATLGCKSRSS